MKTAEKEQGDIKKLVDSSSMVTNFLEFQLQNYKTL